MRADIASAWRTQSAGHGVCRPVSPPAFVQVRPPRANEGIRTPDLCFTRAPLSLLSYVGTTATGRASAMIVRAHHVTFGDLFHDSAPGEAAVHPGYLHHLVAQMIEVKNLRISFSAIGASRLDLIGLGSGHLFPTPDCVGGGQGDAPRISLPRLPLLVVDAPTREALRGTKTPGLVAPSEAIRTLVLFARPTDHAKKIPAVLVAVALVVMATTTLLATLKAPPTLARLVEGPGQEASEQPDDTVAAKELIIESRQEQRDHHANNRQITEDTHLGSPLCQYQ